MKIRRTRALMAVALTLLAGMVLVACGSSSSKGSSSTASTKSAATAGGGARGAGRFTALRECLKKEGITLPQRVPGGKTGTRRPPSGGAIPFGGGGGGGGFQGGRVPKGVDKAEFEAALKKCGGGGRVPGRFGAGGRLRSPAFTKALASFATCMRKNGVDVPKPNTSGSGPIFSTKGLDTGSAKFRSAQQKCSSLLRVARPGGAQGAPPGGQPIPGGEPPAGQ
jgi:hypothetical protein